MTLAFAFLSLLSTAQDKPIILVENGKSAWHIEALDDTISLRCAQDIQAHLKALSGCMLPIRRAGKSHAILIGTSEPIMDRTKDWCSAFDHEGCFALALHGTICIGALDPEGIHDAAQEFIQGLTGVDLLAPSAFAYTNQKRVIAFPDPYDTYSRPAFVFRMVYYGPARDHDYAAWHQVRRPQPELLSTVDPEWGLWVHTMHRFISPEKLFNSHPEYFAERNGIRVKDQVCLSEPEVLRITIGSLRAMMARDPYAKYWSVSQMDNFNYCQCAQCHRTDSIEGSPSGSILRFVNAVADSFPDKVISTLAYQYSRKAPKVTKPRANVNIMLCSIEEDRSKPIASRDEPGSFTSDLREWSTLTYNIIVWDYVINFSHLLAPFPNWKVLQPNLQLFRDAGVPMVFEQGLSSPGGEMPEFRCYLLAKLLWNPDLNIDSLRTHFMNAYYGEAGVYIDKYTRLLEEELDKSGRALTLYEHPQAHKDGYLSPANIAKYKMLFNSAEASVMDEDAVYQQRVEAARLSIIYAELEVARAMPGTEHGLFEKNTEDAWVAKPYFVELLDTFSLRATRHGCTMLHENGLSVETYRTAFSDFLKNGVVQHLAVGKKISFLEPPATQYTGGSQAALIDGFRASTNYQFGWQGWWGKDMVATLDLGTVQDVTGVEPGFLQDQQSWIFLPPSALVEGSLDGIHWTLITDKLFRNTAMKGPNAIMKEEIIFEDTKRMRFIRLTVYNQGPLPAWHGSKGQCWLFCDEIVVR